MFSLNLIFNQKSNQAGLMIDTKRWLSVINYKRIRHHPRGIDCGAPRLHNSSTNWMQRGGGFAYGGERGGLR
jgi:hypothetical protein